jgi:multiple sugar transport system permease protein
MKSSKVFHGAIAAPTQRAAGRRWSALATHAVRYAVLVLLSVLFGFPFLWMVSGALKSNDELFRSPPVLLPQAWQWHNFVEVFRFQPYAWHYANSLYIAVLVTLGTLLVASLAGYAFARLRFRGSSVVLLVLLSTLMMPAEVTIIPNYLLMRALNLTNTHIPLIVIPILTTSGVLGAVLVRQSMLAIPREIEESARLDGLSYFGVYWRIALPLSGPALSAVAILTFLQSWNQFLEPLIYLNDQHLFTLPLSLRAFTDFSGTPIWNLQLAATTLSVLPILIVYLVAQRAIIESFALSGVKG